MASFLYLAPDLKTARFSIREGLEDTTERHPFEMVAAPMKPCVDPIGELDRLPDLMGAVVEMHGQQAWPGHAHLHFAREAIRRGRRVWFHWPAEKAIECIDEERLRSYRHLRLFIASLAAYRRVRSWFVRAWVLVSMPYWVYRTVEARLNRREVAVAAEDDSLAVVERSSRAITALAEAAAPVPLTAGPPAPTATNRLPGTGIYLRTDYWARITSGGSYGHTCYVAKELAAVTDDFLCFVASPFSLLDEFKVRQVVLPSPSETSNEIELLRAHWVYYPQLELALRALRPAYIYERLCLGNFCGAALSQKLGIPYIVEYNGSEISMSRSFGGVGLTYEDVFVRAEDVAFKQATLISVVSAAIKESLVARGVDRDKILVNPNGADPDVYAPMAPDRRRALRTELGFEDEDCVVGFSGTFGGWHGIDVLAAAIPAICSRAPRARFLLIGDGQEKPQIDELVVRHNLVSRVRCPGRVPQLEGARLLAACDVYVSPHSSHMIDGRFFGSPTKLFEYMALQQGIVGSDLEQLGEVLSPALRTSDLAHPGLAVTDQRAVLCPPGDVNDFVAAVVGLIERPEISAALGRNARQAVLDQYSWQQHVAHVWRFNAELNRTWAERAAQAPRPNLVETGDTYKDAVQKQWDHNPAGSHYARSTQRHSLEWYREIESYRYQKYAPWMPELMEFDRHRGESVLEIGGGVGTDLSQFASHGAVVTDLDLSAGHLAHAKENFALRGLRGEFAHHDAEHLPFADNSFDLVYSNGVIHHTPNTRHVVREIHRVLKPGGKAIVMVYAENSLYYWYRVIWEIGVKQKLLDSCSVAEIMSRHVEMTQNDAKPLVKVYSARALQRLFADFTSIEIHKRQFEAAELPAPLRPWISLDTLGRLMGWNLIIKAIKPRS